MRLLLTYLFLAVSTLSFGQLTIKNSSGKTAHFVIGYYNGGTVYNQFAGKTEGAFNTKGWYKLSDGESKQVIDKLNNKSYYIAILYKDATYKVGQYPIENDLIYTLSTYCELEQFGVIVNANGPESAGCKPGFHLIDIQDYSSYTYTIRNKK